MGSWNATCLLSNLPIRVGEPVKVILTINEFNEGHHKLYTLPIDAVYNDYGSVEEIIETKYTKQIFVFLQDQLKTGFLIATDQEHKPISQFKDLDQIFDIAERNNLRFNHIMDPHYFKTKYELEPLWRMENPYYLYPTNDVIHIEMMHRHIYNDLLDNPMPYLQDLGFYRKKMEELKTEYKDLKDYMDNHSLFFSFRVDEYARKPNPNRFGNEFDNIQAYLANIDWIRERILENIPEFNMLLSETIQFIGNMFMLRKKWTTEGAGSQMEEYPQFRRLFTSALDQLRRSESNEE